LSYIGLPPKANFTSGLLDRFTSTTGTTVTLTHDISSENDIVVFVNFVKQDSTTYSVGGSGNKTLTLGGTLVSADIVEVHYLNIVGQTVNPSANSVGSSQLTTDSITGQTAETSIADDDTIIIHDTSASALKKMTKANFVSGIGGANTPSFHAYLSSAQSISNITQTLIQFNTEAFDSDGAYDTSTYKFTPQEAGKYVVYAQMTPNSGDDYDTFELQIYKNAVSTAGTQALCRGRNESSDTKYINRIVEFNGSTDFVFVYTYQDSSASRNIRGTKYDTFFGAYKLIGV
tara:strand:- start:560 stop:1423 length:864 start_codon:yes stop_codon:yes gene_type:complete